ncbi:TPA: helix-turn-helix transcriptional regulator [Clostridium botulinum]|nr:helix-turn-helix transcriptional regulator [Clostridium botulinum]
MFRKVGIYLALADYLKKSRLENNISQRELAKISGVSNSEISKIESGQRQMPKPDILKKISESLNIEYSILAQKCGYINYDKYCTNYYDGNILIKTIDEVGEIRKQKYLNANDEIINKVVQKVNKELNIEFQINYKIKHDFYFDAIAFNKYDDIFCLQVEYMNTQSPYYFIDSIINKFKARFLDYYMYFKGKENTGNTYYQAVLVLDNVELVQEIEQKFKKEIALINNFFSYKIYFYDELINI